MRKTLLLLGILVPAFGYPLAMGGGMGMGMGMGPPCGFPFPPCIPIDSGIIFLALAGVTFGAYKLFRQLRGAT